MSGTDVIGDIHGEGDKLERLLDLLGYSHGRHPDGRKIIFLADFINRGDQHKKVFKLVWNLMAQGTAESILGNHELSLIRYLHEGPNGYIRPHTPDNATYHTKFLKEFPVGSDALNEIITWMKTLKVYIQKPDFNVVHAFWSEEIIKACAPYINQNGQLNDAAYIALDESAHPETYTLFDTLTAGPKYQLPDGLSFMDNTGFIKHSSHVYWWKDHAPLEDAINKGHEVVPKLNTAHLEDIQALRTKFAAAAGPKPLFIGHYSLTEKPGLMKPSIACVDFRGKVSAYRWNEGDTGLSPDRLICV